MLRSAQHDNEDDRNGEAEIVKELLEGVAAMKAYREGRMALRKKKVSTAKKHGRRAKGKARG